MSVVEYCNNGPWKCRPAGVCGDIIDTRNNRLYGSMMYLDALEIVSQLNQRHRWFIAPEAFRPDHPSPADTKET